MNTRHKTSPSFSSSLLDEIYRSIDGEGERKVKEERQRRSARDTSTTYKEFLVPAHRTAEARVTCQQKIGEKVTVTRNWSSSSSSSSSVGGFSSSETESRSSRFTRPKPIRTCFPVQNQKVEHLKDQKPKKSENGFVRTKAKAMKLYGEFKKVKQPISPGGRIASFLNSLFTVSTPRKTKPSSTTRAPSDETISRNYNPKPKSSCASTCSSASSFSRSCLSNSRERTSDGVKRSVRFYPVSVVLGEENNNYNNNNNNRLQYKSETRNMINEELKAARNLLMKNYQKAEFEYLNAQNNKINRKVNVAKFNDVDDDDDDDVASCASSDLFELDHLSTIEELPVYETTHIRTNLAIAKGLIS